MKRPATLAMTPAQHAIYRRLLDAAQAIGPFREDPKKTSIHLMRTSAFAGVTTRKDALLVTIKAAEDIPSPRVVKHLRASARRWYLDVRLESPDEVDRELTAWLSRAMELAARSGEGDRTCARAVSAWRRAPLSWRSAPRPSRR